MAYGDKASEGSKIVETNCVLWQIAKLNSNRSEKSYRSFNHFEFETQREILDVITIDVFVAYYDHIFMGPIFYMLLNKKNCFCYNLVNVLRYCDHKQS
jgi:hypothetical protein